MSWLITVDAPRQRLMPPTLQLGADLADAVCDALEELDIAGVNSADNPVSFQITAEYRP